MLTRQLGLNAWVSYLDQAQLPVLRRTVTDLAGLGEREDELNGRELTAVILHDPIMTVKVLRYLESHRGKSQVTDITTIDRAIMMLGTTPFFRQFSDQPLGRLSHGHGRHDAGHEPGAPCRPVRAGLVGAAP